MGFDKRYFNTKKIIQTAKSRGFQEFKEYMLNSDSFLFTDDSYNIWKNFVDSSEQDKEILYNQIKELKQLNYE